jgi:hypothetical protein
MIKYFFIGFLFSLSSNLFAQGSTNSSESGNFNNSATWLSSINLTGTANILDGHTITIPSNNTVFSNKIMFEGTGKLIFSNSSSVWLPASNFNNSPTTESVNNTINWKTNWKTNQAWADEYYGNYHYTPWIDSHQAWSAPYTNNGTDNLQYDLQSVRWIQGIVTQGRANYNNGQYVTSAKVELSTDNSTWIEAKNTSGSTTFLLNNNGDTKVQNRFSSVMYARYIRVTPITVIGHASMRLGILLR